MKWTIFSRPLSLVHKDDFLDNLLLLKMNEEENDENDGNDHNDDNDDSDDIRENHTISPQYFSFHFQKKITIFLLNAFSNKIFNLFLIKNALKIVNNNPHAKKKAPR